MHGGWIVRNFVIVMLVLMALEAFGKIVLIKNGDFTRSPSAMAFDVAANIIMIAWGAYLLGGQS